MESVVLLGCFIVLGAGGFFLMGKTDRLIEHIREDDKNRSQTYCLRIAASDYYDAYFIADFLSDMAEQYPDLQCTLWVGQEEELLRYFDRKDVDVIIVSPGIEIPEHYSKYISLSTHHLKINKGAVTLIPLATCTQQRKIFWQNDDSHPLVPEFVKQLCQVHL